MEYKNRRARQISITTFGRDMRRPIMESCKIIHDGNNQQIDDIEELHKERIERVSLSKLPGDDEYYALSFIRANES